MSYFKILNAKIGSRLRRVKAPCLGASLLLLLAATGTTASSITPKGGSATFRAADATFDADQLIVAPPNASYISYNEFSNFVVNEPLQVFNLPNAGKPAADVVIIVVDRLDITSSIELIGPPSDILLIEKQRSGVDGKITCVNCSFYNFNRITLGVINTAKLSGFGQNMSSVGALDSTVSSGNATIANLYAPAALSLEVLSTRVDLTGEIDLNQKVRQDGTGSYNKDLNGNKRIGAGSVNLFMGAVTYDYHEREVTKSIPHNGAAINLKGAINAPSVRILSSYPLNVSTVIDTRTDLLSTTMYRGEITIVNESVVVETINLPASSNLTVTNRIVSEGSIDLRSAGSLILSGSAKINAPEVNIISVENWYNYGKAEATILSAGAKAVENEGQILAFDQVHIESEDYIFNQYGGEIQSDDIQLLSENGIVRNGSKTPYKTSGSESNRLIEYADSYVSELKIESLRLGAFYQEGVSVDTSNQNLVAAPVSSAKILGNTIAVSGAAFENINPYYVLTEDDGSAMVDRNKALQVRMSANEGLLVTTNDYILNSSALIEVNSPTGLLHLKTAFFNNERYRTQTHLSFENSLEREVLNPIFNDGQVVNEDYSETLSTRVAVYSTPGTVVSMNDMKVEASLSVLNNTAYIEVFGDVVVDSPLVSSLGNVLRQVTRGNSSTFSTHNETGGGGSIPFYGFGDISDSSVAVGAELDTLFYVGGIVTSEYENWFSNNRPLNDFFGAAIANTGTIPNDGKSCIEAKVGSDENPDGTVDNYVISQGRDCGSEARPGYEEYELTTTVDEIKNPFVATEAEAGENNAALDNPFTVEWTREQLVIENCDFVSDCYDAELGVNEVEGAVSFDIFNTLRRYYFEATEWFADLYEEVKFW